MSLVRLAVLSIVGALAACAPEEKVEGCVWPDEPTPPTTTVTESCGWYLLDVGDHLYINVYIREPNIECEADWVPGLEVPDPIYSDMSNEEPKWTFDVKAQVPGSEMPVSITCADGTTLEVLIDVQ